MAEDTRLIFVAYSEEEGTLAREFWGSTVRVIIAKPIPMLDEKIIPMIIMCDKCKKPARIVQRVERDELVIEARCHGEVEQARISRHDLEKDPLLAPQINEAFGVAFLQPAVLANA